MPSKKVRKICLQRKDDRDCEEIRSKSKIWLLNAQGKNKRNIAERNQIEIRSQRAGRVRLDRPIYLPKLATGDAKLCDDGDDGDDAKLCDEDSDEKCYF